MEVASGNRSLSPMPKQCWPLSWCISSLLTCARWRMQSSNCRMRCLSTSHSACRIITVSPSACASSPKVASSSTRTPSPPHLPKPPYCRTSAKSSILWAISKTTVSIAIRQRRQQYRLTNSCASPMKGLRPATMRSKVVHGCSPYSISSMTLPRRQRTTWSRLSQR